MLNRLVILIATILILSGVAVSQARNVDNFEIGDDRVAVYFYDPLDRLNDLDQNFGSKDDKQKSDALDAYLHNNPLYLFKLVNGKSKKIRFLVIRGNPAKTKTKMFYKVEFVDNVLADFSPLDNKYEDKVSQVIDAVNCGGTLFENMTLFDDDKNKKLVGNGIQLFGYFRRVQPYSEIKTSMTSIIQQLSAK
jgi:hypothetical protein